MTKGTQRVSPRRRHLTTHLTRLALTAAIALTVEGGAVALPATSIAASRPATAGSAATSPIVAIPTAALQRGTDAVALRGPVTAAAAVALTTTPDVVTAASTTTVVRATTYTEASSILRYSGSWAYAYSRLYLGGRAKYSRAAGASATASFSGVGVSWIGPTGPTRGSARVYIDGRLVRTVSTYSSTFVARKTLFSTSWSSTGAHTMKIVVVGTRGRPVVTVDAVSVRRRVTVTSTTSGRTVNVSSISALKSALADNTVGQIVVANGTYRVSAAASQASNSLWIGSRFGGRTRAVLVRAATRGSVTFDGGGTGIFGCITFLQTAHNQTWDGFNCANGRASQTGVITFGGYPNLSGSPSYITLRYWKILSSARGSATSASAPATDHAIYISDARGAGPNHLTFDHITVDGRGGLASAFHFFHSVTGAPNASYVTVRYLHVTGTQQAIMLWDSTLRSIVFDGVSVSGALRFGVRYEATGASGIVFRNVTTVNSGSRGWYSSMGSSPPGVTLSGNSFH